MRRPVPVPSISHPVGAGCGLGEQASLGRKEKRMWQIHILDGALSAVTTDRETGRTKVTVLEWDPETEAQIVVDIDSGRTRIVPVRSDSE